MKAVLVCIVLAALAACSPKPTAAPPAKQIELTDSDWAIGAIRTLEARREAAWRLHDARKLSALYRKDAIVAFGADLAVGRDDIAKQIAVSLADKNFSMQCNRGFPDVSVSRDMAYAMSTCLRTRTDEKTREEIVLSSSELTVYQKSSDGAWRIAAENGTETELGPLTFVPEQVQEPIAITEFYPAPSARRN